MSSHFHHEPSSAHLDGETDQFLLRDGTPAGSSTPSNSQADAKRDRRRQQVREAQARFRDRKDRTVEELKHRTMLLSEALEKVKADNRVLRARLSRYEQVDLIGDDPMDGIVGPSARSQGPATWPISSNGQRQRRLSSEESRPPLLSESSVSDWDQGTDGYRTAEPLPLGTSMPFDGRRNQSGLSSAPNTYGQGMTNNQAMQGSPQSMSHGLDPGRLHLADNSPISAAEAKYRKLQEGLMDANSADFSTGYSTTNPERSNRPQPQAPRIELTHPGGAWAAAAMPNFGFGYPDSSLAPQRSWRGSLSPGQQMPPPDSMQLRNQGRQSGGVPGNGGRRFADGSEQQSSQGRRLMQGPPIGENMQTSLGRVSRWQASMAPTDMFDVASESTARDVDQLNSNGRRNLPDGEMGRGRRPGWGG